MPDAKDGINLFFIRTTSKSSHCTLAKPVVFRKQMGDT